MVAVKMVGNASEGVGGESSTRGFAGMEFYFIVITFPFPGNTIELRKIISLSIFPVFLKFLTIRFLFSRYEQRIGVGLVQFLISIHFLFDFLLSFFFNFFDIGIRVFLGAMIRSGVIHITESFWFLLILIPVRQEDAFRVTIIAFSSSSYNMNTVFLDPFILD